MPPIADILRSLRCDRSPNDRRRSPRVGLRKRIVVQAVHRCEGQQVGWMRDLSDGGAGLVLPRGLRADQPVMLHICGPEQDTLVVRCRVVHCAKVGSFYRVGVEFLHKPWLNAKPKNGAAVEDFDELVAHFRQISLAVMD